MAHRNFPSANDINMFFKKNIYILIILLLLTCIINWFNGCTSLKKSGAGDLDEICLIHSTHNLKIKNQVSECFNIPMEKIDEYLFYSEEGKTRKKEDIPQLAVRMQDELEDKIVNILMRNIEKAMGKAVNKHWHFDRIKIPAVFRNFSSFRDNRYYVKAVAAIKKDALAPRAIIKYLPLEYKMDLLEKKDKDLLR